MRAGQQDRAFEKTGFLDPVDPRHVAVAILVEGCGEDGIPVAAGPGEDRGDTGADGPLAGDQPALALDERHVPDGRAGNVGNGVEPASLPREWNPQIPSPRWRLRPGRNGHGCRAQQHEEQTNTARSSRPASRKLTLETSHRNLIETVSLGTVTLSTKGPTR